MKKIVLFFSISIVCLLIFIALYALSGNYINNIQVDECTTRTERIINIRAGTSYDIVFSDNHGDHYYINRGLERGLNLETLNATVLNKTVTLHLPKLWLGTSEHIAQLAVGDSIIFTEFN